MSVLTREDYRWLAAYRDDLKWRLSRALAKVDKSKPPAGYVMVPIEPTGRMLRAAHDVMWDRKKNGQEWVSSRDKHRLRYRAMLKARPR